MKKLGTICCIFVSVVVLIFSSYSKPKAQSTEVETLKIGSLRCLTGWFSPLDAQDERELRIEAQLINEKGGITVKGKRYNIEIVTEDTQSTLDGARSAANKLIFKDKVKFVVETVDIFTFGSNELFTQNKIIHVCPCNVLAPNSMGPNTPYKFIGDAIIYGDFIGVFKALKKFYPAVKTYAQIQPDDGSIPAITAILDDLAKRDGYTRVGDVVPYANETVDFSSITAKLNAIKGVDCVIQPTGIAQHMGPIVKQYRQLGNDALYCYVMGSQGSDIVEIAGPEAATNLFGIKITSDAPDNPPLIKELVKATVTKYGPSAMTGSCANSLYVLLEAIKAAQSLDPVVVKAKWETMDTIDTLFGPGTMGGEKLYGLKNHANAHPLPVQQVMNGKVTSRGYVDIGRIP